MKFINKNTIKVDKVLNELDKLVLGFIGILKKYADYVIVSGYVAILLGRSRATEDVDIFIKELGKAGFILLYTDLQKHGYWCLNGEDENELYQYLHDRLALRFAMKNEIVPNFEVKLAKRKLDYAAFEDRITVSMPKGSIFISSLERQIAYKRYYLKSDKDIEDAVHIEKLFKEHLDTKKILAYKKLIEHEMA